MRVWVTKLYNCNNLISWGSSTSTTVTWDVTGSATYGGIGVSVTYGVSRTFTIYQFCKEPSTIEVNNLSWNYKDNAGQTTATTYTLTEIPTNSYRYQHVYYQVNGLFFHFANWQFFTINVNAGDDFTYEV